MARAGSGTVYLHKGRKRYVAELYLGKDASGANGPSSGRRQMWRYYASDDSPRSYEDAKLQLAQAVVERARGTPLLLPREPATPVPKPETLGDFLAYWLAEHVAVRRAPRTHESYEAIVRLHLVPALGEVPLGALDPRHLLDFFSALRTSGVGLRTQALSYAVLHAALEKAVQWGRIPANVADRIDKPQSVAKEKLAWTSAEARTFLEGAAGDRMYSLYVLTIATGFRKGEVTGLCWQDVDLERGVVRLSRQLQKIAGEYVLRDLKTPRSRRTLPLTPYVAALLHRQREQQTAERLLADVWFDEWGLLFTARAGRPINGPWLTHHFERTLQGLGLPRIVFHDLRHTMGSLLAGSGSPLPLVRDILGHTQLSTTDRYLHASPDAFRKAMEPYWRELGLE